MCCAALSLYVGKRSAVVELTLQFVVIYAILRLAITRISPEPDLRRRLASKDNALPRQRLEGTVSEFQERSLLRLTSQLKTLATLTSVTVIWSRNQARSSLTFVSDLRAVSSFVVRSWDASSSGYDSIVLACFVGTARAGRAQ